MRGRRSHWVYHEELDCVTGSAKTIEQRCQRLLRHGTPAQYPGFGPGEIEHRAGRLCEGIVSAAVQDDHGVRRVRFREENGLGMGSNRRFTTAIETGRRQRPKATTERFANQKRRQRVIAAAKPDRAGRANDAGSETSVCRCGGH